MSFNGNEGEQISLTQGAELTGRYQTSNPDSVKGIFFGREKIRALLDQPDCMGVRIYLGQDAQGNPSLVLVGADAQENDLLEFVLDVGHRCPPSCSGQNPLNSNLKSGLK